MFENLNIYNKKEDNDRVKNIPNTKDRTCHCDSWLSHWELFSEELADKCVAFGCSKDAALGAHVKKIGKDNKEYIIPFCDRHNQLEDEEISLVKDVKFVSANIDQTCG